MAEYMIQGDTLTAIGDAIRAKTGDTATLTPAQMATAIEGISTGHPNGREWTECTFDVEPSYIRKVVKGGGMYVLGTTNTGMYYSEDGKAWTSAGISTSVADLVFATGIWAAACNKGLYYSTDGKAWTQSNITDDAHAVLCGNGLWVAVTDVGPWYSEDGKTWTQSNITDTLYKALTYANGLWVAVSAATTGMEDNTGAAYSEDGKTWTKSNITDVAFTKPVVAETGVWVTASGKISEGKGLYYSTDGKEWTQSNITSGALYTSIVCGDGLWFATTADANFSISSYVSTDGKTWEQSDIVTLAHANGVWIGLSFSTGETFYSEDGKTWMQSDGAINGLLPAYAVGIWLSGSSYSTDNGKTWQAAQGKSGLESAVHVNNMWFGWEASGKVLYYSVTWEA